MGNGFDKTDINTECIFDNFFTVTRNCTATDNRARKFFVNLGKESFYKSYGVT